LILLRYLSKEVLLNTTAVSLVLLLVMLSGRFVKYLANAAAGTLDTGVVFELILYRIPDFLQLILPLGLFIALLLVYGRLYMDNEMRVLFAAGISRLQVLFSVLVPVFLVTGVVAIITLWITPNTMAKVEIIYHQQNGRSELDSLKAGQFQPFRDNRGVIYTEAIDNETSIQPSPAVTGAPSSLVQQPVQQPLQLPVAVQQQSPMRMKNVYIFQQQEFQREDSSQRGDMIVVANSGKQVVNEQDRYLVLDQGYRLRDLKNENRFEKVEFVHYGQRIENREQTEAQLETDALPSDVLRLSNRLDYQVAWQWRLSVILLVPIVALIAVALGKVDPRQGRYFKILPAILLYLLYLILLNVVRDQLTAHRLPLTLGMWWVHGLFLLVGYGLFNFENWMRILPPRRAERQNSERMS